MRLQVISRCILACLVTLLSSSLQAHSGSTETLGTERFVTIHLSDYHRQLPALIAAGYELMGVDYPNKLVTLSIGDLTFSELSSTIAAAGFAPLEFVSLDEVSLADTPDTRYQTYAKVATTIDQQVADHGDLVQKTIIGKTTEGRDIIAVKISSDVATHHPERPAILFFSNIHAREIMPPEIALDTINYLVTNYASDETVKTWLDKNEVWIIPMLNPDGNNKVWNGSRMWRKNTRSPSGVDINRNFPYGWNSCGGSSGSTSQDDYRGPSAASEPETKAMMEFAKSIKPVFAFSYHSYSELVLYPYGCDGKYTPDQALFKKMGSDLAGLLPNDAGSGNYTPGTPWEILYSADGTELDYLYQEIGAFSFVFEMNKPSGFNPLSGFQPPYTKRDPTVMKLRKAWTYILNRAQQSGIRGIVTDKAGTAMTNVSVLVTGLGKNKYKKTMTNNLDGSFHFVLDAGMYHVTAKSSTGTYESDLTVGEDLAVLDVTL